MVHTKRHIRPEQTSKGTRACEKISRFAPLVGLVLDDPQHKAISEKILSLATYAKLDLDGEITGFEGLFVVYPPTFVLYCIVNEHLWESRDSRDHGLQSIIDVCVCKFMH